MPQEIYANMRQRIDTAAAWAAENPVLGAGEIGIVSGTEPRQFKIGDGTTAWNALSFANGGGSTIDSIDDISDVNLSLLQPPSDGRTLIYQQGEWIAGPVVGGYSYEQGGDQYYTNTKLLINPVAAPGSTTFTDESLSAYTINAVGGIVNSSAQVRTGNSSIYCDGVDNRLQITPANNDFSFGTGAYTMEMWVYPLQNNISQAILQGSGSGFPPHYVRLSASGLASYFLGAGGQWGAYGDSSNQYTANAWNHIAVTRDTGANFKIWVNGVGTVLYYNVYGNWDTTSNVTDLTIGGANGDSHLNGYISGVRITKGICRYTANFTPNPLEQFLGLPTTISLPYSIGNHDDVDIETDPPANGETLVWDSVEEKFIPGAVGLTTLSVEALSDTQTNLSPNASADFTIAAGSVFNLLSITASHPAWIRIYSSAAARTADTRTDPGAPYPDPGSGFLAEILTTTLAETVTLSPVVTGQGTAGLAYVRVVNKHTATANVETTFSVLTLS